MAELPAYHGRTHAAGGTDPIPGVAGGLRWAYANYGEQSHTADGSDRIRFHLQSLHTNATDLYELNDITSDTIRGGGAQWASNLAINEGGYYLMFFDVHSNTRDVFSTFNTYIDPIYKTGGTDTQLSSSDFKGNMREIRTARSELRAASEWNHFGMHMMVTAWHDPAFNGQNPLLISCRIVTDCNSAVTVGMSLVVIQVARITPDVTVTDL